HRDDVPALRLGRRPRGRAGADQRGRHRDLRRRRRRHARERALAEPAREAARRSLTVTPQPRLPSWWLEDALAPEDGAAAAPALEGDTVADVAIVGGGYTGLWTALALRERAPDLSVSVVEAEICGAGPSGRNGGFCHGYWSALSSVLP